jgi:hypothetical protein
MIHFNMAVGNEEIPEPRDVSSFSRYKCVLGVGNTGLYTWKFYYPIFRADDARKL